MKYHFNVAIVAIALLFSGEIAFAQVYQNYISASGGYSLPVGKFAKAKPDDPLAGLAGSGLNGQVNYDRTLWRTIGIRVSGSINKNKTNPGPMIDKANSYAAVTGKTYGWQSDVSDWKFGAILIGPSVYINVRKLQIEGHVQGGIVNAKTPSVHLIGHALTASGQTDPASQQIDITLERRQVTPFGFGGGISIRYPINKHLFVNVNSDIVTAQAEVKNLAVKAKVGTTQLSDQISDKRFIGVVNIGAGIGFAF